MAGGRGAAEIKAGASRRAEGLREPRKPMQLVGAVKTEEALVVKPQAQTIHKQLQVGCLSVSASAEPRLHAGMLVIQICLCNRS